MGTDPTAPHGRDSDPMSTRRERVTAIVEQIRSELRPLRDHWRSTGTLPPHTPRVDAPTLFDGQEPS